MKTTTLFRLAGAISCLLTLSGSAGIAQGRPEPSAPRPAQSGGFDLIEQLENRMRSVAREARLSVVTIEGRPHAMKLATPRIAVGNVYGAPGNPGGSGGGGTGGSSNSGQSAQSPSDQDIAEAIRRANQLLRMPVLGSGFLLQGGCIVTTADVLERMRDPVVTLHDGKKIKVEWSNTDSASNIAILKVSGVEPKQGLRWGESDEVSAGSLALTVGVMGGYSHSVSLGFISGVGRAGRSGSTTYENLIQFQGAVGGGSGGPLLNMRGEVVGMIVAVPAQEMGVAVNAEKSAGGAVATGLPLAGLSQMAFALPSTELKPAVARLLKREEERGQPGWMGVLLSVNEEDDELIPARLVGVHVGGPADKAGAMPGDLVTSANGEKIRTAEEFRAILRHTRSGQRLNLQVKRGDKTISLSVTIEPRPDAKAIRAMKVRSVSAQSGQATPSAPLPLRPLNAQGVQPLEGEIAPLPPLHPPAPTRNVTMDD